MTYVTNRTPTATGGLRVERLVRRFEATAALDDVSFATGDGEFLVLLGPSGCGKTTLLRLLAGLLPPTSGRIVLDGRDITAVAPRERDVAMVFQNYALYPHLDVRRNLGFGLRVRGLRRPAIHRKVDEVGDLLGLTDLLDRRPKELSGGQRQRVALGRAIVREPRAFLMDEPLSNLDARLRADMRAELVRLHRRLGTTFVYVTHDQIDAMTMATRVVVMNGGRLEQVGTPDEVFDEPASTFVAGFLGAPPMNLLPVELRADGGTINARGTDVEATLWPGEPDRTDVVLGVRPEHLLPDGDGELEIRAVVDLVENLGGEEVAICDVGDRRVAVRGPRPLGLHGGDAVVLRARSAHLHLFDATSGRRLARAAERPLARHA